MKLWISIAVLAAAPLAAQGQTVPQVPPRGPQGLAQRGVPGRDAAKGGSESGAPAERDSEESEADRRREAEFRTAVRSIDVSTDTGTILGALEVLRDGFPESRQVLHECVAAGTVKTKAYALRLLGEVGSVEDDLDVVEEGLRDLDERVRLAAVMAIRKLGKDGLDALLACLKADRSVNNRKMAIKTLQHWAEKDCVAPLVDLLKSEKDEGVRAFGFTALRVITRMKFGDDLVAWQEYADHLAVQRQAQDLMEKGQAEGEAKS
jgi:hypothetical protein